jgi:exodeoxyribonuclease VIII
MNSKPEYLLVDLETLDKKPGGLILTIGATRFCFGEPFTSVRWTTFYTRINIPESAKLGATIDADTVNWWMNQAEEARNMAFMGGKGLSPFDALAQFLEWGGDWGALAGIYGNSPSFDLDILAWYFETLGFEVPWSYQQELDVRTEVAVATRHGVVVESIRNTIRRENPHLMKHHALDDAIFETELVLRCDAAMRGQPFTNPI